MSALMKTNQRRAGWFLCRIHSVQLYVSNAAPTGSYRTRQRYLRGQNIGACTRPTSTLGAIAMCSTTLSTSSQAKQLPVHLKAVDGGLKKLEQASSAPT